MKLKNVLTVFKNVFVKRKYKDVLFRFVFREPREMLQLYNAMNHTDYTNPDDLVITTMEDVIYMGMKNDLSFLIANELNLYEHQSTLNRNMPLRGLLYLAKMYESYIETHGLNRYQKKLIRLPFPRFVVFYNGEGDVAEEFTMRLSEAFDDKEDEPAVECVAKFININYGHNKELMDKCKRLHDYSYFVACVKKYLQQGLDQHDAVVSATDECIDKGILADILIKNRAEVIDMFLTTFDKKMYREALREEIRDEMNEQLERLASRNEELVSEISELSFKNEDLSLRNEDLSLRNEDLSLRNEDLSLRNEDLSLKNAELAQNHVESQRKQARLLKEKGISFEDARDIMVGFNVEELAQIYTEELDM